jgi:hypothetical protein
MNKYLMSIIIGLIFFGQACAAYADGSPDKSIAIVESGTIQNTTEGVTGFFIKTNKLLAPEKINVLDSEGHNLRLPVSQVGFRYNVFLGAHKPLVGKWAGFYMGFDQPEGAYPASGYPNYVYFECREIKGGVCSK